MSNNPLTLLLMIGVSAYVIKLWFDDLGSWRKGKANERALPGATSAPKRACVVAALGTLVLLGGETFGELALGLAEKQSKITALFAVYTLCAAFVEEIIFRGYIVPPTKSWPVRWVGVGLASLLFAALHPFLWDWQDSHIVWQLDAKGWFSTAAVFLTSLWFYIVRFAGFNPRQSLGPCFAGHLTKNTGVIIIKAIQGYLVGWY